VIVILLDTVTVQVAPVAEVHPDHELKLLFPAVAGALKISVAPELRPLTLNDVVPVVSRLVTLFPYEMVTPLAGFALATEIA